MNWVPLFFHEQVITNKILLSGRTKLKLVKHTSWIKEMEKLENEDTCPICIGWLLMFGGQPWLETKVLLIFESWLGFLSVLLYVTHIHVSMSYLIYVNMSFISFIIVVWFCAFCSTGKSFCNFFLSIEEKVHEAKCGFGFQNWF